MRQEPCPWESSAFANSNSLSISFQKKLFETAATSSKTLTGSPRRERNVPVSSKHSRSFAASLFHLITCDVCCSRSQARDERVASDLSAPAFGHFIHAEKTPSCCLTPAKPPFTAWLLCKHTARCTFTIQQTRLGLFLLTPGTQLHSFAHT